MISEDTLVDLLPPEHITVDLRVTLAVGLGGLACVVGGESTPPGWWLNLVDTLTTPHPADLLGVKIPETPGVYEWVGRVTGPFTDDLDWEWQGTLREVSSDTEPPTQRDPTLPKT